MELSAFGRADRESHVPTTEPSTTDIRRWRRYLADERAEAALYRELADRREGEEREILLALSEAERRHESHWLDLLGDRVGPPRRPTMRHRVLGLLARRFGSVFILALAQRAEGRSPYEQDSDATDRMAADERIHEEVLRGLAARGRNRLSGNFRAAVFGANDGLVSNLALVVGMSATGVDPAVVLAAGIAGLLAGAMSMGAGEFISVRSQRELLDASRPGPAAGEAVHDLDLEENELVLVYRARGMSAEEAAERAAQVLRGGERRQHPALPAAGAPAAAAPPAAAQVDDHEVVGSGVGAAVSSFCFFASGAAIPVLPYLFGLGGAAALATAAVLVGVALLFTGAVVGLLSGTSPGLRALRQLGIGYGAALVTYLLGLLFGAGAVG